MLRYCINQGKQSRARARQIKYKTTHYHTPSSGIPSMWWWVVHAVGSSFLHAFMFIVAVKARPHHTKRALVVRKNITDCFPWCKLRCAAEKIHMKAEPQSKQSSSWRWRGRELNWINLNLNLANQSHMAYFYLCADDAPTRKDDLMIAKMLQK